MTLSIPPVAPLTFPLTGSHLIEASAGTGKTFTIAMLYVRLVLGHGGVHAFQGGPLNPPEILVVTFTDAAAKELRDRIRARLTEAAAYFRANPEQVTVPDKPDVLHDLRAEYPEAEWTGCAYRLELAAEWMDEAAVSTIHSWCNRMLREHAFDSQSLFNQKLEKDQGELLSEVVRDYWRIFYYPLTADAVIRVVAYWASPDLLEQSVKPLLAHAERLPDALVAPADILLESMAERQRRVSELKQPWQSWADELQSLFDQEKAAGNINGKLQQRWYTGWFDKLKAWAMSEEESVDIATGWERLTPEGLAEAWKTMPPSHRALDAIQQIKPTLAELPEPRGDLLAHAARWIAGEFDAVQKRRAQMGFNELLTGLEAALGGVNGECLAATIRRQFPVGLIDEFQDTDPIQYRIFDQVYAISENRQDCSLILIGDPKQAIYAFRGADIYTYLKARKAVNGRLYTLNTNFRSTQAMVNACNQSFAPIEQQASSAGAFLFRSPSDNPVPFLPVHANGRKEDFQVDKRTLPAMTLAVLPSEDKPAEAAYIARMAEICATRIVDWLNRGQAGRAGFAGEDGVFTAVKPGDMAILVNNGREALAIRQSLSLRGVRSVYLSDRDTVYATPQAGEVLRWLAACAEPDNDRLLRAALSTPTLEFSFAELDRLNTDEEEWEARVVQFKGYREVWQKQGILAMIRRILFDFSCNERLLGLESDPLGQSGERILTDLLHLAELLQQASFTLEGEHALIRFLSEQIAEPDGEGDERKLRLESDADLIKVVTVYKAKGLEYPLVFLPFICATRLTKSSDVPLKWHDDDGELRISLEAAPEILDRADRDRFGEDLRKVYVALTRARYLTWLGLCPLYEGRGNAKTRKPSAIDYLFGLQTLEDAGYRQGVKAFVSDQAYFNVPDELPVDDARYTAKIQSKVHGEAVRPVRPVKENWWIGSYSALHIEGHDLPARTLMDDTPHADNLMEARREVLPNGPMDLRAGGSIHGFPKGAAAGTFLHELMEYLASVGFTDVMADQAVLRDAIARRCKLRRWEGWIDPLCDWTRQMLATPLPAGRSSIRLDELKTAKAEMEFWFEADGVDLARLDAEVIAHTLDGRDRPRLTAGTLNGMLKGYMDLVFEHQGRYYVADYKSNWLGATDGAYTSAAMDEAIRAHRYDLQYVIYLLALHRLLKSRMPDYDYDRHVGGAIYLFVRGIGATTRGVHFEKPPKTLIVTLDRIFAGVSGGVR